jgi:transcription-repair coupling factor (superfamily II helicase)
MPVDFSPFKKAVARLENETRIYNLTGSSASLFFAIHQDAFIVFEANEERAEELFRDINFFRDSLKKERVLFLPESDGPSRSGIRAQVAGSLDGTRPLVTSFNNITSLFRTGEAIDQNLLHIKKGIELNRDDIEKKLHDNGYRNVSLVAEKGEYSRRGWLLDIFPSTAETPLRIEFFGDVIESIRLFDIETQRSGEDVEEYFVFPAEEPRSGITLMELMKGAKCFFSDSIRDREIIPSDAVIFSGYSIRGQGSAAGTLSLQGLGIIPEERKDIGEMPAAIARLQSENRVIIVSPSGGQAQRLKDILHEGGIIAPVIDAAEIFEYGGRISISIGNLSSGLYIPGLVILTEKEIFGTRPVFRPIKKSKVAKLLTSLDDLNPGDFVVHTDHGIGKFQGLVCQSIDGIKEDLMTIEYEGGRLYIPLQAITRIHKYHSEEGVAPKVDRLGGKTWERTRERVRKKIQDMAEKLISLYAAREISSGFSFSADTVLHREFDEFFPYEETPDQTEAIRDIKKDMESDRPMDRLICGDVGYGKTEVAMRAAFKAVFDGLQVIVLVPTTILCEQHFRTFRARFSAFPVTVDYLSRFKPAGQQKKTVTDLSRGNIDIVIGTHSLLGKDIRFNRPGLLIIDEEHRFGVRQKEKMKEIKKGLDVLSLTATPIPRTLYMALSDIRDMSVIETPPEERLAVKSIVSTFDGALIKAAIRKEIERNGQIFFVHNRIKDIYTISDYLRRGIPLLRVGVAHGQMNEKDLEKVMMNFYEHNIDVLVSTAIIGSGLDIPTANTIVINRADMMGLADLYQLRGRVGRGNVRAYAYFLVPGEDIITDEAKQRLQAIQDMSYLGAGFRLAMKDLEIRGAGNLLGAEQSGHIHAVGFDLYLEMLEKAVAELKGHKIEEEFEPSINVRVEAFIPEEYISETTLRLSLYRKIASSKTFDDIKALEDEIDDRFGALPVAVKNLLKVMRLKISARALLISSILDMGGRLQILFSQDTMVQPADIFEIGKRAGGKIRFLPEGFELNVSGLTWEAVYDTLSEMMHDLGKSASLLV